ncbi:MAG: AEC family transporter [Verrucomicrobiales bacterium]|nr:AEC family transporter [Verrucomicrobiales bacterium]
MYSIFEIFTSVCLPILVLIVVGWGLDRKFSLDLRTLVKLNIYLFVPAFILVKLSSSSIPGKTGALVMLFTVCIIASMGLVSWLVSRLRKDPPHDRAGLQLSTMIYNSGNWGIPLLTLAFPDQGGVLQVFVLATMNLTTFTCGVFLATSTREENVDSIWKNLLPIFKQPSVYAIATAIAFRVFGNPLDDIVFIWKPLNYIAAGLVGFALLTLGVQLSKTQPPRPVGRLGWALGIRLLGGPAIAVGLTWLFGISGTFAAILIVGAASPTAVNTALLAYEFGTDSRFAAAAVYYSTLSATVVVTLILAVLHAGWIPWAVPG